MYKSMWGDVAIIMPLAFSFPISAIKDKSLCFLLHTKKLGQSRGIAQAQDRAERKVAAAKRNCKRGKKQHRGERYTYIFYELARAEMESLPCDIFNPD